MTFPSLMSRSSARVQLKLVVNRNRRHLEPQSNLPPADVINALRKQVFSATRLPSCAVLNPHYLPSHKDVIRNCQGTSWNPGTWCACCVSSSLPVHPLLQVKGSLFGCFSHITLGFLTHCTKHSIHRPTESASASLHFSQLSLQTEFMLFKKVIWID